MTSKTFEVDNTKQLLKWAEKAVGPCCSCGNPYFTSESFETDRDTGIKVRVVSCGNCGEQFTDMSASVARDLQRKLTDTQAKLASAVELLGGARLAMKFSMGEPDMVTDWTNFMSAIHDFLASLEERPRTKLDPATFIGIDPGKEDK